MKAVVLYTYFSSPSSDYNLRFFVQKELTYKPDLDYVLVINGFECPVALPVLDNLTVLRRPNEGFDFGGHAHALAHLQKKYDYYFFMNSGVIGPIAPHYVDWPAVFIKKITHKVKLVGTSIVCLPAHDGGGYGPKVEGFFFAVDALGLALLQQEKTIFCNHADKGRAIVDGEYGLSNCILKHGYSIDCMLPRYQGLDWTDPKNHTLNQNQSPSRHASFYGTSIAPSDVIFHKWFWHGQHPVNWELVERHVAEFQTNLKA
jgi:hypothetical protein